MFPKLIKSFPFLNIISLVILLYLFSTFFKSSFDFLKFILFFLLVFITGFGFLNVTNVKFKSSMLYILASLIIGICLNIFIFFISSLQNIHYIYAIWILPPIGLFLVFLKYKDAWNILKTIDIHKDPILIGIIVIILFSMFFISDSIYYTKDNVVTTSVVLQPYQLSIANSIKSTSNITDISYLGKGLNYHFGYPILLLQLVNSFKIDELSLIHFAIPIFFISIVIFILNEISKSIISEKLRLFFITLVLFSAAGIFINIPLFLFGLVLVGGFAISILMLLLLFIMIRMPERNFLIECILLTGIALTKFPFFIPLAFGYTFAFIYQLFYDRNIKKFIKHCLILLPGAFWFLFFVLLKGSSHKHDLWIIFPGIMNILSTTLDKKYLLINALASFAVAIFAYLGVSIIYIAAMIKRRIKNLGLCRLDGPYPFYVSIIICSYLAGIFICEIVEGTQMLFLFPGHLLLFILTLEFLFNKFKYKKLIIVLLIILLLINFQPGLFKTSLYNSSKFILEEKNPSENNLLANIKLEMIDYLVKFTGSESKIKMRLCSYSNDLLNGLKILSQMEDGNLVFNKIYETCESYNESKYYHTRTNGFIRTAISGKQTIIEGYQERGLMAEPDYCERLYENLLFFTVISTKEDNLASNVDYMLNEGVPRIENMSYYQYFRYYNSDNFYTIHHNIQDCLMAKPHSLQMNPSESLESLRNYIAKYNVKYILFERRDKPLPVYIHDLNLKQIYSSETVNIYETLNKND